MKYFLLDTIIEDKWGTSFMLGIDRSKVKTDYYSRLIAPDKLQKTDTIVSLFPNLEKGVKLILRDFHKWDLGQPSGYQIVCSPRFRSVLENLYLPPHRFYSAEIDVLGKTEHFFVLHFLFDYLDEMDYAQSQFALAQLLQNEPVLHLYKAGEIESKNQYNQLNTKLIDENKWIYARKVVFPQLKRFDIFSFRGYIILSEVAKNEIEKAQITGVDLPPITGDDYFKGIEIEFTSFVQPKSKPYKMVEVEVDFIVAEPPNELGR